MATITTSKGQGGLIIRIHNITDYNIDSITVKDDSNKTLITKTFSSITDDITIKLPASEMTSTAENISLLINGDDAVTITLLHTASDMTKNMWQYYDYYLTW